MRQAASNAWRPVLPYGPRRVPTNASTAWIRRLASSGPRQPPVAAGSRDATLAQLEAVLFAAREPLTTKRLAQVAGIARVADVRPLVRKLQMLLEEEGSAFGVTELAGGFQMLTLPAYHRWLARVGHGAAEARLTAASRETLAIIAYKQPIMRAEIEAIRGVQSGETLRWLMEHNLARITGRHDSLGRPVLYGTTKKFLQLYGLKGLQDLPVLGR